MLLPPALLGIAQVQPAIPVSEMKALSVMRRPRCPMRAGQATWAECTTSCVSWLKTPIIAVNGFPALDLHELAPFALASG
jgi:hypothetical protein